MARSLDPFEEMDRMFSTFGARSAGGVMPMDAFEKDGLYTLRFDLPGADPDAVDVTVEGGELTVKSARPEEETEGVNWLIRERPAGTHSRKIRLGPELDTGSVEASYDHGVLTITVPMRAEAKPHKVSVSTGGKSSLGSGD